MPNIYNTCCIGVVDYEIKIQFIIFFLQIKCFYIGILQLLMCFLVSLSLPFGHARMRYSIFMVAIVFKLYVRWPRQLYKLFFCSKKNEIHGVQRPQWIAVIHHTQAVCMLALYNRQKNTFLSHVECNLIYVSPLT